MCRTRCKASNDRRNELSDSSVSLSHLGISQAAEEELEATKSLNPDDRNLTQDEQTARDWCTENSWRDFICISQGLGNHVMTGNKLGQQPVRGLRRGPSKIPDWTNGSA